MIGSHAGVIYRRECVISVPLFPYIAINWENNTSESYYDVIGLQQMLSSIAN